MENKLTVTNYDNFKNADFFINQYFKAEEMIKEVNEFFQSFYMSKLLTAKDLINLRPNKFGGDSETTWTSEIVGLDICDKCHAYELSEYYDNSYYKKTEKDFEEIRIRLKENIEKCMITIYNMMNNKYDCYYVLDEKNNLHEFIPVASKDSIKVNFKNKKTNNIIIEGSFYRYYEIGGRWGKCEYSLRKITRKIYINRYTNNVVKIDSITKEINGGEVAGKNYWSTQDCYCMSHLEKNSHYVNTNTFDHCKEGITKWVEYRVKEGYVKNNEDRKKLIEDVHLTWDERYQNSYNENLKDKFINEKVDKYLKYYQKEY